VEGGVTLGYVYTNNGAGAQFTVAGSFASGSAPYDVVAGDWNGDGYLDLAALNNGGTLLVYTNKGLSGAALAPATFVTSQTVTVGSGPRSATTEDVNMDGRVDILVANFGGSTVTVITNAGGTAGLFAVASSPATGAGDISIAGGDFNQDGFPDFVTVNYTAGTLSIMTNNGSGSFSAWQTPSIGAASTAYGVAAGAVTAAGLPGIMVANYSTSKVTLLTGQWNETVTGSVTPTGGMTLPLGASLTFTHGTGARAGTSVLASGTVTVSNTTIATGDYVALTYATAATSVGILSAPVASFTAGTSFIINSLTTAAAVNTSDTNIVYWELRHLN
jgi:hypothetical protein